MKKWWWEAIFDDAPDSESDTRVLTTIQLERRVPVEGFERTERFGYEHFLRRLQEPPPLSPKKIQTPPRLVYLAYELADYLLN